MAWLTLDVNVNDAGSPLATRYHAATTKLPGLTVWKIWVQPPGGLTVLNMPEVVSGQQADGVLTVEVIDYDERTAVAWAPAVEAGRRDARAVVEAQTVAVQLDSPRAFVQVMLWDARDWEDVWAARSSAFVPHQIADDTDEFADIIAAAVGSSGHVRE